MTILVSKMTETDVISTITTWMATLISKITLDTSFNALRPPETTLEAMLSLKHISGMQGIIPKELNAYKESLRTKLLHLGFSLVRMDRFLNVLQMVKDNLIKEGKKILQQVISKVSLYITIGISRNSKGIYKNKESSVFLFS